MTYCEDCSSYDCGCPERKEIESLRQQVVEYQTKHDVACSTITLLQEKCEVRGKALAAQCEETKELRQQLETERMRLAACGVVALSNTPESAAKARDMLPDYHSASCDDVARAVDREMKLRQKLTTLGEFCETLKERIVGLENELNHEKAVSSRTEVVKSLSEQNESLRQQLTATEPKQQEYRGPYVAKEQGR